MHSLSSRSGVSSLSSRYPNLPSPSWRSPSWPALDTNRDRDSVPSLAFYLYPSSDERGERSHRLHGHHAGVVSTSLAIRPRSNPIVGVTPDRHITRTRWPALASQSGDASRVCKRATWSRSLAAGVGPLGQWPIRRPRGVKAHSTVHRQRMPPQPCGSVRRRRSGHRPERGEWLVQLPRGTAATNRVRNNAAPPANPVGGVIMATLLV